METKKKITCRKEYDKKRYSQNKEKFKLYSKQYRENNKELISIKSKKFRDNNKELISMSNKIYRDNNKIKININRVEYRLKNKKEICLRNKIHKENNKFNDRYIFKQKVRKQFNYYKNKFPNLFPKICSFCNETKNIEYHHPAYNFSLSVYPVCKKHHGDIHSTIEVSL